MANQYDTSKMKSGADAISKELETFSAAKRQLNTLVDSMNSKAWNDTTNRQFVSRYGREARVAAEELEAEMHRYAALLKECAKRYANAIDTGNSWLSS